MNITGNMINYYIYCKRRCWLSANKINLENNSEDVRIGTILHEIRSKGKRNTEIKIDNIKIDKITDEYLTEIKKSDSDVECAKWQILYYLKVLKDKGVYKKGKIEYIETKTQNKKTHYIELTEELEKELIRLIDEINKYINEDKPLEVKLKPRCKKCAYYEYCIF